mgnify:CR=1 FL=1
MKQTITVEGMHCGHCKQAVEGAVRELRGVTEAVVDLDAKTLTVTFDEGAVTLADIEEAVEDQGFDVVR